MQSLTIPDTFRNPNGYTADEIREALQGVTGSRKLSFRYELLDENNKKKRDLDTVEASQISQNWLADIKRTATFTLRSGFEDPIDYLKDRIKPWVRLHMPAKAIQPPPTELPPEPQSPPFFGGMTDNFESAEKSSVWATYANGVANVGGKLRIPAKPDFPGAESNATWVLTGSQVVVEVNTVPSATGGTDVATSVVIESATQGTNLTIQYRLRGFGLENKLEFLNFSNNFQDPNSVAIDYNPTEHRWWRIRESNGTIFWETSATGFPGTWQVQRTDVRPAWVVNESGTLRLFIQSNRDGGPEDFAELDNLNLAPEGVETAFMPQQEWFNNLNGTPGPAGVGRLKVLATKGTTSLDDFVEVTVPSDGSVVPGDFLIVGAAHSSGTRTMNLTSTVSAGWTDHGRQSFSGHSSEMWTKIAVSGDIGGFIRVTPSSPDIPQVIILAKVSNVDQTNPLGVVPAVAGSASATSSTNHNATPTITGTAADTREINFVFDSQVAAHDWNAPYPIIRENAGNVNSITVPGGSTAACGDSPTRTSGTIGGRVWTKSISSAGSSWTLGVLGAVTADPAEPITTNNSARSGDALDDVLGTAIYDDAYSIDNKKSAKLGDDSGASGGTLVARLRTALPFWSCRFHYFLPPGGILTFRPDGANPNTSNDIVINDATDTVTLGTVNVPDFLKPNFVNRLVKVEIITTLTLTVYRVFWTDPTSSSPDYVTSESNVGRDPLQTITVAGGGSSTPPAWFDNMLVTEPLTFEPFTPDSVNFVEWPQGVFILSSPQRDSDSANVISRNIQGYDLAQVLHEEQVPDRFSTANLLRVDDNFTRATTGNWGTSADGTVWLHNNPANTVFGTDVSGFAFTRIGDDSTSIRISQAGNTNQEVLVNSEVFVRLGVSQLATGNSLLTGVIFRLFSVNNYYRLRIPFTTSGQVHLQVTSTNAGLVTQYGATVNSGLTYTAGEFFNVRAQMIDNVMRAKVWKTGAVEPTLWMIQETITNTVTHGFTGVSGSNFSGMTNINPEHRFDLFQLNPNPGNTYTGVVEHILTESNLPRKITPSTAVLPTVREWEAGTSKRQIVNDLLAAINYESLSFDEDGFAVVKPYVSPQIRGSEYTYADDDLSVMYPEMMQELDLFTVPNRWILTVSDPDRDTISVDFTNMDPASPTSVVRRGRTITDFRQEQDADSEATLIDKATRLAFEASQVFEAIEFDTALMPIHSGNDVYTLTYDPMGINAQYSEVSWTMDLRAGSKMKHRARRVVSLVAAQDPSIINESVDVTGALDAGNIAAGVMSVVPVANKPTSAKVTGLNLQGRGPVRVFVTADSTVPGSQFKEVTTADHTPFGFTIWVYRTNTTSTGIQWFAIRGA